MNKIYSFLKYIYMGFLISLVLTLTFILGSFSNNTDPIIDPHRVIIFDMLKSHIINNNLSLLDKKLINGSWVSDGGLYEFHNFVELNYKYSENEYDCKYWSFIWSLYALKHDIDFRYILLDTHIFVILEMGEKYCVADGQKLDCKYFK